MNKKQKTLIWGSICSILFILLVTGAAARLGSVLYDPSLRILYPQNLNATFSSITNTGILDGSSTGVITNFATIHVDEFNATTLNVSDAIDGVTITNAPDIKATNLIVITGLTLPAGSVAEAAVHADIARDSEVTAAITANTNLAHLNVTNLITVNVNTETNIVDQMTVTNLVVQNFAIQTNSIGFGTVTNNIAAVMAAPVATNIIDMNFASRVVTLDSALTFLYVTNAVADRELTHTLYLRAGGSDRALEIPSTWQTNAFSPKPANITNGWLTKIYVTTIGATGDSASQTNAMVSFEYYKVP